MPLTLGEAKRKAIKYLRVYSNAGVIIPDADNADYRNAFNDFADTAQRQISEFSKIHEVYSISRNPIIPVNGLFSGLDIKQFLPSATNPGSTDLIDIVGVNGRAYYFEIDAPCTLVVEESANGTTWITLSTQTITDIYAYTPFKGLITPSSITNQVRTRLTGNYPFNRRYAAIWDVPFASIDDIPSYADRVRYPIPQDFFQLNPTHPIVHRTDVRTYESMVDFQWEKRRDTIINYFYNGSFDVQYYKYPIKIYDALNSNTVTTETGMIASNGTDYYGVQFIKLPSSSSKTDKDYTGQTIEITAGTGIGQKRVISNYVGRSKQLYVQIPWTILPDATSQYAIKQYTLDDYIFEVYEEAAEAIPFFMSGMAYLDEYQTISRILLQEYKERLANLQTNEQPSVVTARSVYGW
jgi:hypothetical protein